MRQLHRARRAVVVATVATLALTAAACTAPTTAEPSTPSGDTTIGMNQLQYLGTHNSYKRQPSAWLILLLKLGAAAFPGLAGQGLDPAQIDYGHRPLTDQLDSGLRSFELDVWADPTGGRFAKPLAAQFLGQPYPTGMDAPGFKVFHIPEVDYLATCPTLDACLTEMRHWSDAHPGHLPITIDIELEQDALPAPFDVTPIQQFDAPTLDSLDAEIRSALGDRLITPDDVRGSAPDLRTAVTRPGSGGGWPSVHDSRGRFLFFMDNPGTLPLRYLDGHPSGAGRVMFTSDGFDRPDAAVLKVNEPGDGSGIAALVRQGFLVRTRADADVVSPGVDRAAALSSGAQMVDSDFPKGEPQAGTGYVVSFPTRVQARCNPVNTTPMTCTAAAAVEPTSRPPS
ncbi:MAG: hypothetical protein JST64_04350 [Actinobacteria bacterium]|nr:hypothetical protein [Actinomycetota bacterium]